MTSAAAPPAEDLTAVKKELSELMLRLPYDPDSTMYISRDYIGADITDIPFGKDQKYYGMVLHGKPHGWGIVEHHDGLVQTNERWLDGVPCGFGTLSVAGEYRAWYGHWVQGKREGYFATVKDGIQLIEVYEKGTGNLLRRIKWRKDNGMHETCARCSLFVNTRTCNVKNPRCRYHPEGTASNGAYECCGAFEAYNPMGCEFTEHTFTPKAKTDGGEEGKAPPPKA